MKPKSAAPAPDEMRMKAADFDRIMRGVLDAPPQVSKPTKVRAKTAKTKKITKK
jgi:hypothetical protein